LGKGKYGVIRIVYDYDTPATNFIINCRNSIFKIGFKRRKFYFNQKKNYMSGIINYMRIICTVALSAILSFQLQAKKTEHPNVIFILTDQWRASALGYGGNEIVQTPQLDKFASSALNFKNTVSVLPVCTPYRASLMTGRYPTSTGMFINDLYLPSEELCMAEIFKDAGYQTAYLGKWHLDGHGRLKNVIPERRQGFDFWKGLECSHDYNKMPYYENNDKEMKY
jgi:phosphoglycerol transferase MdoB-like AlkP superfamily enzyme